MSKIDDGGPAFPGRHDADHETWCGRAKKAVEETSESESIAWPGMTLRQWYAGRANENDIQAFIRVPGMAQTGAKQAEADAIARVDARYRFADAMIAAEKHQQEQPDVTD